MTLDSKLRIASSPPPLDMVVAKLFRLPRFACVVQSRWPFYMVYMPVEVKYPKHITCRGLTNSGLGEEMDATKSSIVYTRHDDGQPM